MTPRGGKREGAGRPTREDKEGKQPKVILSCRVEQETKDFLQAEEARTGWSIGQVIDLAISTLQEHPEKLAVQEKDTQESEQDELQMQDITSKEPNITEIIS